MELKMYDPTGKSAAIFAAMRKMEQINSEWYAADNEEKAARAIIAEQQQRLAAATARKQATNVTFAELKKIGELFDFDLLAEFRKNIEQQSAESRTAPSAAALTAVERQSDEGTARKTIRDRLLDAAKAAHPGPVRSAALRAQLEREGTRTHIKTVGMTLYRLLQDGALRRNGWDWFFVPEDQRASAGTTGEENSGDEPELSMAAE
jgi:hypothetical protein